MMRHPPTGTLAGLALALSCGVSANAASVPQPPPPPNCKTCSPPPPPPMLVPTVAATIVPSQPVVDVHLAASKVARGQTEKLSVVGRTNDAVTLVVQYKTGKPVTYLSKVGSSRTVTQQWKVPKNAPIGKAAIKVTVKGSAPYSKTISFIVTR